MQLSAQNHNFALAVKYLDFQTESKILYYLIRIIVNILQLYDLSFDLKM
jgi:hypothetical protein